MLKSTSKSQISQGSHQADKRSRRFCKWQRQRCVPTGRLRPRPRITFGKTYILRVSFRIQMYEFPNHTKLNRCCQLFEVLWICEDIFGKVFFQQIGRNRHKQTSRHNSDNVKVHGETGPEKTSPILTPRKKNTTRRVSNRNRNLDINF